LRYREQQTAHRGKLRGQLIETDKRPLRHLVPMILMGLYTGTRIGAVLTASYRKGPARSFVDLDIGVFYRLDEGKRATNKRQPPIPIPPRLLAHLRRWTAKEPSREFVVEWQGKPVTWVKTGFQTACRLAGLEGNVTPHTLRHTAATWLMQAGVDKWDASGFLGMSLEMLDRVYGHHHPDHLRSAAHAMSFGRRVSLAEALAAHSAARRPISDVIENAGGLERTRTACQARSRCRTDSTVRGSGGSRDERRLTRNLMFVKYQDGRDATLVPSVGRRHAGSLAISAIADRPRTLSMRSVSLRRGIA
jgi:hypothetical protein